MSYQLLSHIPSPSLGAANDEGFSYLYELKDSVASQKLFDNIQPATAAAGRTDYRVLYVRNATTFTLLGVKAYINSQTSSADTSAQIGLGLKAAFLPTQIASQQYEAVNNTCELAIADTVTAPAGVSFVDAATLGTAISLGDIPAGYLKAIWVKRVVNAGAAATTSDTMSIRITNGVA